jgi:hypothetical protein
MKMQSLAAEAETIVKNGYPWESSFTVFLFL